MNVFNRAYRIQNPLEWKKLLRQMYIPLLLILFICIMPMYLLYTQNITEMQFVLILTPIAVSVACGMGLLAALTMILRKPSVAGLWSAAVMALCLNFNLVTAVSGTILPFMDPAISGILLIVLVLAGVFFLVHLLEKKQMQNQVALILMATMGVLLLYNTITIMPTVIPAIMRSFKETSRSVAGGEASQPAPRIKMAVNTSMENMELVNPNIYMFLMDEYADFVMYEKYYNSGEAAFKQFLINAGFNISGSSYSNSISTPKCIADLVNLDYVTTEKMTDAEARKLSKKNAALHTAWQALGYSLYQVSTGKSEFNQIISLRDPEILAKAQALTENGETVEEIATGNSILSLFNRNNSAAGEDTGGLEQTQLLTTWEVLASAKYENMNPDWKPWIRNILGLFDFFQNSANLNFNGKTVVYSYICSPHVPFWFNANGSILEGQRYNWSNKAYYSGQHQFVSRRLQLVVASILLHNPDCIIILQSDHGVRNHKSKVVIERNDDRRIFNAVYFGGQVLDIEGKSGINTLRLVLTKLGAAGYPQVADPMHTQVAAGGKGE